MPLALVLVDAFDEAASGMPVSAMYALRDAYDARIAELSAAVFVAPYLVALLVEGPLLLWAERHARHHMLALGLFGMAGSLLACAFAPNLLVFALSFGFYAPASGLACGIAQAALMDGAPERREESMTDWATAGWIGDLCGPAFLWAADELGFGYRAVFMLVALLCCVPALGFLHRSLAQAPAHAENDEQPSLVESLRLLSRQRALFLWLFGVALCSLLDEVVAGLLGLRIDAHTRSPELVAQSLLAFSLGGLAGLLALKPLLLRVSPSRLLVASCAGTLVFYALWLGAEPKPASALLLLGVGVFVAAHYPLAQAQAYRALPERSTLVSAAAQPFTLLELLLPLAVGFCSDRIGVVAGLLLLSVQPLGLLLVVLLSTRRSAPPGRS